MIQFDLIGLVVKDMGKSLAFYRRLGLKIPAHNDADEHVEVTLQGGMRLAWDTVALVQRFHPEWVPPSGSSKIVLAFKCEGPENVDVTYSDLVAAGYVGVKPPWDAFWGQRYAIISDPDGNAVDLFAPI